jgi:hypothetical protein
MLTEHDKAYLKKRDMLVRAWPVAGAILLAALLLLLGWILWRSPYLLNPYAMMQRIREGAIDQGMLKLMAGTLPVAFLSILALMGAMVAFAFAAFANEKRHLRIIRGLLSHSGTTETESTLSG